MKNVKNVSLNYVRGFKCVGDINYDLGNLPRLKGGQSGQFDRIATHQLVTNKRRKIDIPVEVEIITVTESLYIKLNYKLEKMQRIEGSRYVCSVREQNLDLLITLNFDELRKELKGKVKEQIESHMKNMMDLMKENEDVMARYIKTNEALVEKSKENDVLTDKNYTLTNDNKNLKNENKNLTDENQNLKNEIVVLEKRLNTMQNDNQNANVFARTMINDFDLTDVQLRFLVENIIKMNNKGKSEMEIFKKVKDYIGNLKGNKKQK
jgi:uncharacterized protein YigA (DUF484 family)